MKAVSESGFSCDTNSSVRPVERILLIHLFKSQDRILIGIVRPSFITFIVSPTVKADRRNNLGFFGGIFSRSCFQVQSCRAHQGWRQRMRLTMQRDCKAHKNVKQQILNEFARRRVTVVVMHVLSCVIMAGRCGGVVNASVAASMSACVTAPEQNRIGVS